jgi:hypothetical protein
MPSQAIFINYRRSDSSGYAGRLRDYLVAQFGGDRVFMDVGILGGNDWVASIEQALSASGAVLMVIGPNWDLPRLQEPTDRLRQELEAAVQLRAEIIPVLVGGARMPDDADLPPSLQTLTRRQAVRLTDEGWADDVRRLMVRLAQLVPPKVIPPTRVRHDEQKSSGIAGLIVGLIFLAIFAGAGYLIYQSVVNTPSGSGGPGGLGGSDPKITISPSSGPPGTIITVTGTGYPAGTDISIWLLGPQAETVSDGSGGFTKTFKVPDTPFAGVQDVIASGGAFSDRAQFTIDGS